MKNIKKAIVVGIAVVTLAAASISAFAASSYKTPAEAVAGLTGRDVQSVTEERAETGKTYGTIANDADKLDEFKAEILEMKKAVLAERVAAGTMTQAEADEIIKAITERQASCDGTGAGGGACGLGGGFGMGKGQGAGNGQGMGRGARGAGMGLGNGSCVSA